MDRAYTLEPFTNYGLSSKPLFTSTSKRVDNIIHTMMNTTDLPPTTPNKRECRWKWGKCLRWMQNNGNKLCAYHNTRFLKGEYPGGTGFLLAGATAPTANTTKKKENGSPTAAAAATLATARRKK